jgi:antitoxin component of RelBE/YafQ-DinJ toxin-antitoxin module
MANATSRLQIQIDAKNNASPAIKGITGDLKSMDNAASTLSGGLGGLAAAAGVGGLLAIGEAAVSAAVDMAKTAAEAERLGTAFNSLASSAGESGNEMLAAMQEASNGTISNMELMASANRAMMLGVADSADEMAQLLEIAGARGKAMGLSMSQAFSDLVTGLGRQSAMILDNLGITVDAEAANEAYAKQLGVTAASLTDAEKKQALLNAVIADSTDILNANADAGEDLATSFERYEAAVTNAQVALGEAFGGPAAMALTILTGYLQSQIGLLEGEKQAAEAAAVALKNLATGSHDVTSQTQAMAEAEGKADDVTRRLTFGLGALGEAAHRAGDGMTAAELKASNLERTLAGLKAQSDATSAALAGISSAAIGALHSAASAAVGILPSGEIAKIYGQNAKALEAQQKAMEAVGMTTEDIDFRMQELAKKSALPFDLAVEAAREAEKANKATATSVEKLSEEYSNLQGKVQSVLAGALDPGVGVDPDDVLEAMGFPREDVINENARRLADIAKNGLMGQEWLDEFQNEVPDIWKMIRLAQNPQEEAARLLKDFQDGLLTSPIDKGMAKEIIKRQIMGDQNMAALANEIATELAAEMGIPMQQALAATSSTLGTGSGAGSQAAATFSEAAVAGLEEENGGSAFVSKFTDQMRASYSLLQTAGRDAGKMWGTEFLSVVGDNVPPGLIDLLTQLVTPGVMAKFAQQGTLQGTAP